MAPFQLFARKSDLDRIFTARQLCFLFSDSTLPSHAGVLARHLARSVTGRLPVVVVPWRADSIDADKRASRDLAADPVCHIYYTNPVVLNGHRADLATKHGLANLNLPPTGFAHLVVDGDTLEASWSGDQSLAEVAGAVEQWLASGDHSGQLPPMIVFCRSAAGEVKRLAPFGERATILELSAGGTQKFDDSTALADAAARIDALLVSSHVAEVERRYRTLGDKHAFALAQLSDLQGDYEKLLNASERLARSGRTITGGGQPVGGYPQMVRRFRDLTKSILPAAAVVAVVTRGDHDLIRFDDRVGWHFPQTKDRVYAGHHPANSEVAITHLEELRDRGAQYLAFPATGFWWLDHYVEFKRHLDTRYEAVVREIETGIIYALTPAAVVEAARARLRGLEEDSARQRQAVERWEVNRRVRTAAAAVLPPEATVLVVNRGDDVLLKLGERRAWAFPLGEGEPPAGQLEALRARGADYLLAPASAFAWLEAQPDLKDHLERQCTELLRHDEVVIYALRKAGKHPAANGKPNELVKTCLGFLP